MMHQAISELHTRRVPAKLLARARASPRALHAHKLGWDMPVLERGG
jgi:hypothetical protein